MHSTELLAARMVGAGFDGHSPPDDLAGLARRGVRTFILFKRNVASPAQVQDLGRALKSLCVDGRAMVTVDQEGGRVRRLRDGFTDVPSMRELGATGDESLARQVGVLLARELRAVNVDLDF